MNVFLADSTAYRVQLSIKNRLIHTSSTEVWMTKSVLSSMKNRGSLHKKLSCEKNTISQTKLFAEFKLKRDLLTFLIRSSKINYYAKCFEDYNNCAKKHGKVLGKASKFPTKTVLTL